MGQRMASQIAGVNLPGSGIVRRPRLCAWSTSVVVHALIFSSLWLARFPYGRTEAEQHVAPSATVSKVHKVVHAAATIPKPKIKAPSAYAKPRASIVRSRADLAGSGEAASVVSPDSLEDIGTRAFELIAPVDEYDLTARVEFFGSSSNKRKVCYVVDCSGSMKGLFERVQRRLKKSILTLQPDQYFHIIFFGGDALFELEDGRLQRASEKARFAACKFVDSMKPAGKTNALSALERAVRVRDTDGNAASVIYFLTDGFDLGGDSESFRGKVSSLLGRFAPQTQINTIGFWPQDEDREMLGAIARQSGGACLLVTSDDDLNEIDARP